MSVYDINSDKYEITLGYDEGMQGFWLIIHYSYETPENKRYDANGDDKYIFHNMNNWPGIRMTIKDVKKVLRTYNEKIDEETFKNLYLNAKEGGFFSSLDIRDFSYNENDLSMLEESSLLNKIINFFKI